MMRPNRLLTAALLLLAALTSPVVLAIQADSLRLEDLQAAAARNWPLARQASLADQIANVNLEAIASVWLPDIFLSATAQYQTDVTQIRLPIPGSNPPSQPKDRYSLSIDVRQLIWDGGIGRARRDLEEWSRQVEKSSVDVDLYQLTQPLMEAFFSAILLSRQLESLELYRQDVEARLSQLRTASVAGTATSIQVDVLHVEAIRLDQRLADTRRHIARAYELMSILSGVALTGMEPLALPRVLPGAGRPETTHLKALSGQLEAARSLSRSSRRPQVMAFGTGAYARPGLDLFDDRFGPYAIVGIRASWSIWDRGAADREHRRISIRQESIAARMETLRRQWALQAASHQAEIDRLDYAIARDSEILRLRRRIVESYGRLFDQGTITATDYLVERNALHQAEIQADLNHLMRRQALLSRILITGDEP